MRVSVHKGTFEMPRRSQDVRSGSQDRGDTTSGYGQRYIKYFQVSYIIYYTDDIRFRLMFDKFTESKETPDSKLRSVLRIRHNKYLFVDFCLLINHKSVLILFMRY